MWTQHYKLCVWIMFLIEERIIIIFSVNSALLAMTNTKKNTWLLLAELRFITIFLVHRTSLLLQKYRSRHIGYYRVRKRSWIPVAYAPVRCAQSVVVTNWAGNCDTRIWFWCNQLNVARQCMLNVSWISQDLTHGICIAVQSLSCHEVDIYWPIKNIKFFFKLLYIILYYLIKLSSRVKRNWINSVDITMLE